MLAFVLAAAIDCTSLKDFRLPAVAVEAQRECGDESPCNRELAEKFANGDGVTRDFDVAAYFLCLAENDMAPAEFGGMTAHLEQMRAGETTDELDFCDHVTSGYGSTYCASIDYDEMMPELDARIDAVRKNAAFAALRERGLAYVRAESERIGIQSRGGTGYAAISLGAEIDAKQKLVLDLERWSETRAGAASAAELEAADAALNESYRTLMKNYSESEDEEVLEWKTFLRDAQRAWIAYRDAFVAYYLERWRGTAPEAALRHEILTQLTLDRARELRNED